ncbi:hypothetical protein FPV67DRAFT_1081176 [Lyophyllum atratum]|nr:hypothetical protein FPV67DRAFT_1081176 [Lyophyllum atratum]
MDDARNPARSDQCVQTTHVSIVESLALRRVSSLLFFIVGIPLLSSEIITRLEWLENTSTTTIPDVGIPEDWDPTEITRDLEHTNHRPSAAQSRTLWTFCMKGVAEVLSMETDVLRLQLQMNRVMDELKTLKTRQSKRKGEVDYCRSFLTRMHVLPLDILAEIFSYSDLSEHGSPRRTAAPLSVSQVSSAWRAAALSTSSLWKSLSLNIDTYYAQLPCEDSELFTTLITTWFSRAKVQPLTFSLHNVQHPFGEISRTIVQEISLLSHRFVELRFSVRSLGDLAPFLTLPRGSVPSLATLFLRVDEFTPAEMVPVTVFDAAPTLRNALIGVPSGIVDDSSLFAFPWGRLTRLDMPCPMSAQTFSRIICQCVGLYSGSFTVDLEQSLVTDGSTIPESTITYEHLAVLRLMLEGSGEGSTVEENIVAETLSKLKFPSIQTLDFSVDSGSEFEFPLIPILSTISSGGQIPLRCLVLSNVFPEADELAHLLTTCTSLEKLGLQIPEMAPEDILEILLQGMGDTHPVPSLPNLESFAIAISDWDVDEPVQISKAFVDLIRLWTTSTSRHSQLQSVSLYWCSDEAELTDCAKTVFAAIREELGPWNYDRDDNSCGTTESGLSLRTQVTEPEFDFSQTLGWYQEGYWIKNVSGYIQLRT